MFLYQAIYPVTINVFYEFLPVPTFVIDIKRDVLLQAGIN